MLNNFFCMFTLTIHVHRAIIVAIMKEKEKEKKGLTYGDPAYDLWATSVDHSAKLTIHVHVVS